MHRLPSNRSYLCLGTVMVQSSGVLSKIRFFDGFAGSVGKVVYVFPNVILNLVLGISYVSLSVVLALFLKRVLLVRSFSFSWQASKKMQGSIYRS